VATVPVPSPSVEGLFVAEFLSRNGSSRRHHKIEKVLGEEPAEELAVNQQRVLGEGTLAALVRHWLERLIDPGSVQRVVSL
jgi:hypothetical protein